MTSESSSTRAFFRQGSWLVLATVAGGVFMTAVHMVVIRYMAPAEYGVFFTLLRVYLLMGIPAAGLQTVFTQQAASALDEPSLARLHTATRAVLAGITGLWVAFVLVTAWFQEDWVRSLKITNPAALWVTVLVGLLLLWLPVLRGILQGRQRFLGLGWVQILDGVGRFSAIVVIVWMGGQAAGGMTGALIGQCVSLLIAVWLVRDALLGKGASFDGKAWLRRVIPLTLGPGVVLIMTNTDVIFVQATFSSKLTPMHYQPAAMIGLAFLTFTTPFAAVMFPKVARSAALTEPSTALRQALLGTTVLGLVTAFACTLLPKLPLQIIYFRDASYWQASPLVPWFAWSLLPLILANVLISNLLARERFAVVPWLVLLGAGYVATLVFLKPQLLALEPVVALRRVVQTLGVFNVLILAVSAWFSRPRSHSS
jgi:O-antigen/teichoic acid export membrane protein